MTPHRLISYLSFVLCLNTGYTAPDCLDIIQIPVGRNVPSSAASSWCEVGAGSSLTTPFSMLSPIPNSSRSGSSVPPVDQIKDLLAEALEDSRESPPCPPLSVPQKALSQRGFRSHASKKTDDSISSSPHPNNLDPQRKPALSREEAFEKLAADLKNQIERVDSVLKMISPYLSEK